MTVTAHLARRIAVLALVDPRTVIAFMHGRPVRELTGMRIRAALKELDMREPKAHTEAPSRAGRRCHR